jgi:16S rRNA (adenine1518-N6/adenine1519-N6)-dimethyltransferase
MTADPADREDRPVGSGPFGGDASPAGDPPSSGLRQISLARIKEFGVVPKRDLGQNFLIDDNILGVILGQLECRPEDVVLEIGAGLGVLTAALAGVARQVHAFEVDRSLQGPLEATLQGDPKVELHFRDALKSKLEELDPPPTLCASNLPYSVAGPFVIESLQGLPAVRRYCIMVQREVAERMTAVPGTKAYGVLSVWVQLYTSVVRSRPLSRTIFYPQPHVDSSLVILDRLPAADLPAVDVARLRRVIQAGFSQRRKTLVNCLSAGLCLSRGESLEMVTALGLPADVRAERLKPKQFVELAARIAPA